MKAIILLMALTSCAIGSQIEVLENEAGCHWDASYPFDAGARELADAGDEPSNPWFCGPVGCPGSGVHGPQAQ